MKRVAIITNRSGGGHISLTKGMVEILKTHLNDVEIETKVLDPIPDIIPFFYSKLSVARFNGAWKFLWNFTDNPRIAHILGHIDHISYGAKIKKFIEEFKPDVVISNSPLSTLGLELVKKSLNADFKTIIHVADPFSVHALWLSNHNVDLILCPTKEVADIAIAAGFDPKKVRTVGWLTRKEYTESTSSFSNARAFLGFSDKDYVLFMGGAGFGDKKVGRICKAIVNSDLKNHIKVVVNTGLNTKSLNKLVKIVSKNPGTFVILPYLPSLKEPIGCADIVIGKAGPNFMFECIHLGKPLIATGCMPGQEEGNLDFILREDIGWVETSPTKVAELIREIMQNPKKVDPKIKNMVKVKKDHMDTSSRIATELRGALI